MYVSKVLYICSGLHRKFLLFALSFDPNPVRIWTYLHFVGSSIHVYLLQNIIRFPIITLLSEIRFSKTIYLVIMIKDNVIEFERKIDNKTSDVEERSNIHMSDGASRNCCVGIWNNLIAIHKDIKKIQFFGRLG